jgi:hypothetical protein
MQLYLEAYLDVGEFCVLRGISNLDSDEGVAR